MRRLTGLSFRYGAVALALSAGSGLPATAAVGEAITMPFSCKDKGGIPTINTAAPTRHEIIGERRKRDYRACKNKSGRDCRTMAVHSFNIRCQGIEAPWAVVAAQIRTNDVGTSWIKDGKLNLLLKKPNQGPAGREMARFIMPKGYAPITELGARLVGDPETAILAVDSDFAWQSGEGSLAGGTGRIVPRIDNAVVRTPGSDYQSEDGWQTIVYLGEHASGGAGSGVSGPTIGQAGSATIMMLVFALTGTSLLAALCWYGRRYALALLAKAPSAALAGRGQQSLDAVSDKLFAGVSGAAGGLVAMLQSRWVSFKWRRLNARKPWEWRNSNIANGAHAAEALYKKADQAVRALGPASALRDTLSVELKGLRQKLDGLRSGPGEKPKTARAAASLRSVVRDLERIGRIAESATGSVKDAGEDLVMPKTRTEAFEVLGVNADATEGTLKRIVDALRMGWHPDHAKDEADKYLREERTKQINIAWDLIVGKRAA